MGGTWSADIDAAAGADEWVMSSLEGYASSPHLKKYEDVRGYNELNVHVSALRKRMTGLKNRMDESEWDRLRLHHCRIVDIVTPAIMDHPPSLNFVKGEMSRLYESVRTTEKSVNQ